jgi:hypothetical protein
MLFWVFGVFEKKVKITKFLNFEHIFLLTFFSDPYRLKLFFEKYSKKSAQKVIFWGLGRGCVKIHQNSGFCRVFGKVQEDLHDF